ncbi:MAG: isocitrate/isopropylmalate dehydrogenase family protein [Candidatus Omnitrophica bacterium]|nr:isocitrate/isopropylmalate dehydrogenase family protein [Candidatus Omnitrophota bacterium]MCF7878002.1 isocitrate/isopropylmalate dehydrogenase family protein [Candidatus Omnitrophota bacterium]
MSYNITVIPGDGIGPEVVKAALACVDAFGLDIKWETKIAGKTSLEQGGDLLPKETIESVKKNKVALKGPITTPVGSGFRSINVAIRQFFDLYVCLRPIKAFNSPKAIYKDIDLIIVRENTEDLYAGVEFKEKDSDTDKLLEIINKTSEKKVRPGSAVSIKPISRSASERIAKFAFEYALRNNRKKISCIHKANIMKYSDGLFLDSFIQVAQKYQAKVESNDVIVDNLAMQLIQKPQNFDMLVLPNLYGDIISDLGAGLVGGLGLAAGANIGEKIAVFEPTHGSAPRHAGKNKVNPAATILSAALMLKHLGEREKAVKLETAVAEVIKEGKVLTYDLKLNRDDPDAAGTQEFAEAVVKKIKNL